MKNAEFLLGILGLSRVERMTIASVCSLTHSRPRGYRILSEERSVDADIMLVDADDATARGLWESSTAHRSGRPALMISRDPNCVGPQPYCLPRTNFATKLLKILDQITIREFKFVPELVVSDNGAADAALNLVTPRRPQLAPRLARALVIDDSAVVRTKMRTLLDLHGIEAELAEDAESGIRYAATHRYRVIFLDVVLPGMDGYAACRQIRNADKHAPPIIMLTSRDTPFDKIRGVMAGCSRYLTKPIAMDDLHKVLREYAVERTGVKT
jgi:two-component system, cell cycle response regulator